MLTGKQRERNACMGMKLLLSEPEYSVTKVEDLAWHVKDLSLSFFTCQKGPAEQLYETILPCSKNSKSHA